MREIRYWRALLSVLVLLLVAAGGLALYMTTSGQRLATFDRLARVAEENTRARFYVEWAEFWPEAPLVGHGAGSWPLLIGRPDQTSYPHNLFLELSVETGIVGLILFFVVVGAALRPVSLDRMRRDPQALCAMMLFANALLNAMTTADLPSNRAVFMMLGVLAMFAVRPVAAARAGPPRQPAAPLNLMEGRRQHAVERFR
jgi:O-antigen ligase